MNQELDRSLQAPQSGAGFFLRLVGVLVMGVGLFLGYKVVDKALELLDTQTGVQAFAIKVEEHSNVDHVFATISDQLMRRQGLPGLGVSSSESEPEQPGDQAAEKPTTESENTVEAKTFKISYFLAWVLTLAILGLVLRVATLLISQGAKLAVDANGHKKMVKSLVRELVVEIRRGKIPST